MLYIPSGNYSNHIYLICHYSSSLRMYLLSLDCFCFGFDAYATVEPSHTHFSPSLMIFRRQANHGISGTVVLRVGSSITSACAHEREE